MIDPVGGLGLCYVDGTAFVVAFTMLGDVKCCPVCIYQFKLKELDRIAAPLCCSSGMELVSIQQQKRKDKKRKIRRWLN